MNGIGASTGCTQSMGYGSKNGSEQKEPEIGRYAKRSGFLTSYKIGSVSPMNGSKSTTLSGGPLI